MKPPKKVIVGPATYVVSSGPLDRSDGTTFHTRRQIVLDTAAPDAEREVLLHEVIHAMIDLTPFRQHEEEEAWVAAISPWLLLVLQQNPKLVEFLTS